MTAQMTFSERVIELPETLHCDYHGAFQWEQFYDDAEIVAMLDDQGYVDCPYCLAAIVGTE
jgi:hypothetical protein